MRPSLIGVRIERIPIYTAERSTTTLKLPQVVNPVRWAKAQSTRGHQRPRQVECESDPEILARRTKQIEIGKNTLAYNKYITALPKHLKQKGQPGTPNKFDKFSRRRWDGLIKAWKIKLHSWENPQSCKSLSKLVSESEISFDGSQDERNSYQHCRSKLDYSPDSSDMGQSTAYQRPCRCQVKCESDPETLTCCKKTDCIWQENTTHTTLCSGKPSKPRKPVQTGFTEQGQL